jgi:hypothetical protein
MPLWGKNCIAHQRYDTKKQPQFPARHGTCIGPQMFVRKLHNRDDQTILCTFCTGVAHCHMRSSKTTFSARASTPSGSLESSFKKLLYSTFHISFQRPIEMLSLLYRELFITSDVIHRFCQAVVLNDLLHTLEFVDRNLHGYRFLILINNDVLCISSI